jgi:predicted nucleotidyltransferase
VPLIERALIYGSFARGSERPGSDIDLLVVGHADPAALRQALRGAEKTLGREINETINDPDEFASLLAEDGGFVQRVLSGPTVPLTEHTRVSS